MALIKNKPQAVYSSSEDEEEALPPFNLLHPQIPTFPFPSYGPLPPSHLAGHVQMPIPSPIFDLAFGDDMLELPFDLLNISGQSDSFQD